MITTLLIILVSLVFVSWIYSMFICWRATEGLPLADIESTLFTKRWEKGTRLTRRGWYLTTRKTKYFLGWTKNRASNILVRFLPQSAHLFKKRDERMGLTNGPSSYFLQRISLKSKTGAKHLPKKRKML